MDYTLLRERHATSVPCQPDSRFRAGAALNERAYAFTTKRTAAGTEGIHAT